MSQALRARRLEYKERMMLKKQVSLKNIFKILIIEHAVRIILTLRLQALERTTMWSRTFRPTPCCTTQMESWTWSWSLRTSGSAWRGTWRTRTSTRRRSRLRPTFSPCPPAWTWAWRTELALATTQAFPAKNFWLSPPVWPHHPPPSWLLIRKSSNIARHTTWQRAWTALNKKPSTTLEQTWMWSLRPRRSQCSGVLPRAGAPCPLASHTAGPAYPSLSTTTSSSRAFSCASSSTRSAWALSTTTSPRRWPAWWRSATSSSRPSSPWRWCSSWPPLDLSNMSATASMSLTD